MDLKNIIKELKKYDREDSFKVENDLILLDGEWDCYRGMYQFPALNYKAWVYMERGNALNNVGQLIDLLENIKSEEMIAWGGGGRMVNENLEVFVSNEGVNTKMCIHSIEKTEYYVNVNLKKYIDKE